MSQNNCRNTRQRTRLYKNQYNRQSNPHYSWYMMPNNHYYSSTSNCRHSGLQMPFFLRSNLEHCVLGR